MDKDKIHEAVSQLKYEYEAYHERMIGRLINEYDGYNSSESVESVPSPSQDEL